MYSAPVSIASKFWCLKVQLHEPNVRPDGRVLAMEGIGMLSLETANALLL